MLTVALGDRRYRVCRPFGAWPGNSGFVTDVTVAADGAVLVMLRHDPLVQGKEDRIIELSPDGAFLRSWGSEIADSHSLTAVPDGRILAVDRDMHEIIIFARDGQRIGGLGQRGGPLNPFNHPTDVGVAANGDIYVSDGYAGRFIHRFSAEGKPIGRWGGEGCAPGQFAEPHALWVLPEGRVAVADRCNDRVQYFSASGEFLFSVGDFRRPVALWGDSEGCLYVTDEIPTLSLLSPHGERLGRCRPMLNGAHGMFGTSDGRLFLAETNPSRVTLLVPFA